MTKELNSDMVSVAKLFSQDFFFRVPAYQRPFLWDADNFSDLVDDLASADRDEPYFLGTLVLHQYAKNQYDIVDGQQRLTALCILLACLRDSSVISQDSDLVKEIHEKIIQPKRKLEGIPEISRVTVKDNAAFNSLVGKIGGASTPFAKQSGSPAEQRYEKARSTFWEKIGEMPEEEVRRFAEFVTVQCHMIYLSTASFNDAFRLFTVVNDRGKQLRRIDVLKAYNLDPAAIANESVRGHYAMRWEALEEQLGEKSFEDIFHLLRLIYVKDKPQKDLYSEFSERILGKSRMPSRGVGFLDELANYVDLYDALFVARDILDDSESGFVHVKYQTLMTGMVKHFPASEWKACLLYFVMRFGKDMLYPLVTTIEKVHLDHWVRGVRKDERYGIYTDILKLIATASSASQVLDEITVDTAAIEAACKATNFYGAGHARYLLVRAEMVTGEHDHVRDFNVRSIEHVLPQNPANGSEWVQSFTEAERESLTNAAGNLVLLSKAKNSAAGRKEFTDKKITYLKPRVSDFPRSLQVVQYDVWTPDVIKARTEAFASLVLGDL
ncbi:DUF262 domain-containing HNH endonuclease family protein [Nonomuraea sp. NPDC049141]|uniref:DUF262 domain-containing protein n=1 Tax=Nonomuraea sp. NPDC049141 TaxID=3155500 RepID=UPI0033E3FE76